MLGMTAQEEYEYLRRLPSYFVSSVTLLMVGGLIGIAAISYYPGFARQFEDSLGEFVRIFRDLPKLQLAGAIFLNNALKTLLVILFGTLLGLIPALFLVVNGAALGIAISVSMQSRGLWPSLLALLPHGVLELPAILLGTSIGLMLGRHAIKKLFGTAETTLRSEIARAIKFFVAVIVPLLIAAALVEAFVTPVLANSDFACRALGLPSIKRVL